MNWRGRRVLLTGHTGFMGGWLSLLLNDLGAEVYGFSLEPPTEPSFYKVTRLRELLAGETIGDVRDRSALSACVQAFQPEVVFHLAAQPLVREAFKSPLETIDVNVMGTACLLDSLRGASAVQAIVVITTDKVYDNVEWTWSYRENDRLGGREPYGISKACAELVVDAYRQSYFTPHGVGLATARSGNVIGGGDWAADRLVPDMVRAFSAGEPVVLRNPAATRPWQHVLEPVTGYLVLAERLLASPSEFSSGWNFGPRSDDQKPVEWIVANCARLWGRGASWCIQPDAQHYEAKRLGVTSEKAELNLGWSPTLRLEQALKLSIEWYSSHLCGGGDMRTRSRSDIAAFEACRKGAGKP